MVLGIKGSSELSMQGQRPSNDQEINVPLILNPHLAHPMFSPRSSTIQGPGLGMVAQKGRKWKGTSGIVCDTAIVHIPPSQAFSQLCAQRQQWGGVLRLMGRNF